MHEYDGVNLTPHLSFASFQDSPILASYQAICAFINLGSRKSGHGVNSLAVSHFGTQGQLVCLHKGLMH